MTTGHTVEVSSEQAMSEQKRGARRLARERRTAALANRSERDRRLVEVLIPWLVKDLPDGGTVVTYDALEGEPDLAGLIESSELAAAQVSLALTRTPEKGFDLTVHPIGVTTEQHRFGYRQPVAGAERINDSAIDVVLVPALAFDSAGNRLGFGAGYYDRFLSRLSAGTRFVGIADEVFDRQLPVEEFDVPMTHVATPDGVTEVGAR